MGEKRSCHHQRGTRIWPLNWIWDVWHYQTEEFKKAILGWEAEIKIWNLVFKVLNIEFKTEVRKCKKIRPLLVWQCEIWFFLSVTFCCNFCSSLDTEWRPCWWGSRRQLGLTWKGNCLLFRTFLQGVGYLTMLTTTKRRDVLGFKNRATKGFSWGWGL